MWLYVGLAALCFGFNYAHYAVGAQLDTAHRQLDVDRAGNWATLAEALSWLDYVIFAALALEDGIWVAVLATAIPSIIGARAGQRWSTKQDWVSERVKRAKKAGRLAKKEPTALDLPET